MKAIVNTKYGCADVLQLTEVEKPVPKSNEVLIRIHATSVSSGDWKMRKAEPFLIRLFFGLTRPKKTILGFVFAGEIDMIGADVTRFKAGEQVYGTTGMDFGAYAEYICLAENKVMALKPGNISYAEAAAIPFGGNTALYFLRKAKIQNAKKVLVYGASGAIGTAAVQLAKYYGAEVTAVCSASNRELVMSLGASKAIDYNYENFANSGEHYDVVFDTVGKAALSDCKQVLTQHGVLILAAAGVSQMLQGLWLALSSRKKVLAGVMSEQAEDLVFFNKLIEAGDFKAVIDKTYPLQQIVQAHRYVEKGHKKGNVIINVV